MDERRASTAFQREMIEWLFLRTFEDIEARTLNWRTASKYELLGLAPLLRKMLLDSRALATAANMYHRLDLQFVAHEMDIEFARTPPPPMILMGGADEEFGPVTHAQFVIPGQDRTPIVNLTLQRWLAHTSVVDGRTLIPVSDLIKFVAHVEGGVHAGTPRTATDKALARVATLFFREDVPRALLHGSPIGSLIGIGTVTVEGLRPLYAAISEARPICR